MAQEPLDLPLESSFLLADDRRLDRRTFVAWSSVGLLAPWVAPLAARAAEETFELTGGAMPLSVGYIVESDLIPNLKRMNPDIRRPGRTGTDEDKAIRYSVVPADELPIGDTSLIGQPLRIRLHGLYPPRLSGFRYWPDLPQRFQLDLLFPNPDPALSEPVRYFGWTFERLSTAWRNSQTTVFNFPLDWNALPEFELRTVGGPKARTLRTRFTFDTESGRPRLRRGLYLFGLEPRAWQTGMSLAELGAKMPRDRFSFLVAFEQDPTGHI